LCGNHLFGGEGVDVGDGLAAQRARDELNVVALHVRDHHHVHLGQKVQGEVVVGVAQDGLLDEQHVAARLLDLLALAQDVLRVNESG
jgi:hypothetical protein